MALKIVIVGLVIFLAHFLVLVFNRTKIPDVLLLMIGGIVVGPIMGLIDPQDLGIVGPIATTIALIVILFESGTHLKLSTLISASGQTMVISLITWIYTAAIVAVIMHYLTPLSWAMSIMTGAILGGTSSAVVLPLIDGLGMKEKPRTVIFLESAITDVICIVAAVGVLEAIKSGNVDAGKIGLNILASFGVAILIGITAGLLWSLTMGFIRKFPNTIFTTVAWVFLVYGVAELAGFSGAIAALSTGVTMANIPGFRIGIGHKEIKVNDLKETDKLFFAETVFLLKTFFFIYLGLSLKFDKIIYSLIALVAIVPIYLGRIGIIKLFASKTYTKRDASLMTMMIPKGLAAAVLATIPMQEGLENAEWISGVVYMVVLATISLTAILVILFERTHLKNSYYSNFKRFASNEAPLHLSQQTENISQQTEDISQQTENNNNLLQLDCDEPQQNIINTALNEDL